MRSYNLDDFGEPPYRDGNGLCINEVMSVHQGTPTFQFDGSFGLEQIWFVHVEDEIAFDFYLYDTIGFGPDLGVRSVQPFVHIHGTTDEGVKACWFSDTEPSDLRSMGTALILADEEIRSRGWSP